MSFRREENGEFRGEVTFLSIILPSSCVGNAQIKSSDPIAASKLEHQHRVKYSQESATLAADEARMIHLVEGTAGTLKKFSAGSVVVCTGTDKVDIDLLKNGVSVLVAKITLDNANTAYVAEAGTIDTDAVAAGDVLEVSIDATAGSGVLAKGVFCSLTLDEDES